MSNLWHFMREKADLGHFWQFRAMNRHSAGRKNSEPVMQDLNHDYNL